MELGFEGANHNSEEVEKDLGKMFRDEEQEHSSLTSQITKLEREREALGEIDAVQLQDYDIDRMALIDSDIPALKKRKEFLDDKLSTEKAKADNIQDLGDID